MASTAYMVRSQYQNHTTTRNVGFENNLDEIYLPRGRRRCVSLTSRMQVCDGYDYVTSFCGFVFRVGALAGSHLCYLPAVNFLNMLSAALGAARLVRIRIAR